MTRPQREQDQDELPFPSTNAPGAEPQAPGREPRGAATRQRYVGRADPDMYTRLSRPWPSQAAAEEAVTSFFEEAHALRIKHGIADVTIVAAVQVSVDGAPNAFVMSHHSGNVAMKLPMIASTFRSLRDQDRETWLAATQPTDDADLARARTWLRAAQERLRKAQNGSDGDALNDARREEQAARLAIVAYGNDTDGNVVAARDRIRGRIAEAEAIAKKSAGAAVALQEPLGAALRALNKGRWWAAVRSIMEAESDLVVRKLGEWVEHDGTDRQRLVPAMSVKDRDRRRCLERQFAARRRGAEAGDRHDSRAADEAGRDEHNWTLALQMHDGELPRVAAQAKLRRRVDTVSAYLLKYGGTDFLNRCRSAVAEERWGDLVDEIARLEYHYVVEGWLRWELGEDDYHCAVPTGKTSESRIPTSIDPGGIGL